MGRPVNKEGREKFFEDLLVRQIDTILTDHIEAQSPDPLRALEDIEEAYDRRLRALGEPQSTSEVGDRAKWSERFGDLMKRSEGALQGRKGTEFGTRELERIKETSRALCSILTDWESSSPDDEGRDRGRDFEYRELAVIQKAWQVRESSIALQSKLWIDGDVITSVAREYASDAGAAIRRVHGDAVETSLRTWESLVRTVGSIVEALLDVGRHR